MLRLTGRARHYDWGSPTVVPEFLGVAPDGQPLAEIWFGAHPSAPALVAVPEEEPLDAVIARAPREVLGQAVADAFGGTLPYLVKLLAADRPLSLQAHPTPEQARAGRARELAAGVPEDRRSYVDDHAKPETLVALAPTHALAGFRDPEDVARDLERLASPALAPVVAALRADGAPAARLERGFAAVLALGDDEVTASLDALERQAPQTSADDAPWGSDALAVARELLDTYPGDAGVLAAVFLHAVDLAPGQALDVEAGVPHCYVHGFGLEVMASSDNVLRAGLTSKRVDVAELMAILDFTPAPARVLAPVPATTDGREPRTGAGATKRYAVAAREYSITVVDVDVQAGGDDPVLVTGTTAGPRILLVLDGEVALSGAHGAHGAESETVEAGRGTALLATDGENVAAVGRGTVAVVAVSLEEPGATSR